MNNNRDFFTKPIQGSRSQHSYGHTQLSECANERLTFSEIAQTVALLSSIAFLVVLIFWL